MEKLSIMCIALVLTGSTVQALDVSIPDWRGDPGSTYQAWEFLTPDIPPAPDVVDNPYGDPELVLTQAGDWISSIDGYEGVWPLSGEIDVWIPNRLPTLWWKDIQIQLTWKPAGLTDPQWDDEPLVGVTPCIDPYKLIMVSTSEGLGQGWMYSVYQIEAIPNPPCEWIAIKGDILVDELVIDTICIPEPATVCLLGLGTLTLLLRRRA
jgi:hypothetical protein